MYHTLLRSLACILLLAALPAALHADGIRLRTGVVFKGEIVAEKPDSIALRLESGSVVEFPRSQIADSWKDEKREKTGSGVSLPESTPPTRAPASRPEPVRVAKPVEGTAIPPEAIELESARTKGLVRYTVKGAGITKVTIEIEPMEDCTVHIPVGSYFEGRASASSRAPQDMLTVKDGVYVLKAGETTKAVVSVACARRTRPIPYERNVLHYAPFKAPPDLKRLAPHLALIRSQWPARQAAVWIVSDNASYADLRILRYGMAGSPGTPAINARAAALGMMICDRAGIALSGRRIWSDRGPLLLAALEPPNRFDEFPEELATWATHQLRRMGYGGNLSAILRGILDREANPTMCREAIRIASELKRTELLPAIESCLQRHANTQGFKDRGFNPNDEYARLKAHSFASSIPAHPGSRPESGAKPSDQPQVHNLLGMVRTGGDEAEQALETLIRATGSFDSPTVRRLIANALIAYLEDGAFTPRTDLPRALRTYRDAVDVPRLVAATRTLERSNCGDLRVSIAATALEPFDEPLATERLIEMLASSSAEITKCATRSLCYHKGALEPLLRMLQRRPPAGATERALALLKNFEIPTNSRHERTLIGFLRNPDPTLRFAALQALGERSGLTYCSELMRLCTSDPDRKVAFQAGFLLGKVGDSRTRVQLEAVLKRSQGHNAMAIKDALGRIARRG